MCHIEQSLSCEPVSFVQELAAAKEPGNAGTRSTAGPAIVGENQEAREFDVP
jgi:hypothetical protein